MDAHLTAPCVILGSDTSRSLLVTLEDPLGLARAQGSIAAAASAIAPGTISAKVYDEFAKQLKDSLSQKGVKATVIPVEPTAFKPAGSTHIAQDIGIAIAATGVLGIVFYLFTRGSK